VSVLDTQKTHAMAHRIVSGVAANVGSRYFGDELAAITLPVSGSPIFHYKNAP